ncbi:putative transcription factor TIFY family [Medicago truncatula]|uniref:Putative transcription factor TIFY family n=1 Tax=Medicago truncatula TaxID=3880 RepID=A0A396IG17_MEDTR|nr:putative transcription factor TIFY family [Medicago truncatula]
MDLFPTNVTPKNVTPVDSLSPRINNSMVKELETAQLTLFYNGEVIVLDDFPAEKVEELKSFASTLKLGLQLFLIGSFNHLLPH